MHLVGGELHGNEVVAVGGEVYGCEVVVTSLAVN